MYASVELASDLGARVQVPAAAVVYTGPRRLVFVDLGQGRFRPQEVPRRRRVERHVRGAVRAEAGDVVATSGVFLIAAEARISTAAKYWDSQRAIAEHAATAATRPRPRRDRSAHCRCTAAADAGSAHAASIAPAVHRGRAARADAAFAAIRFLSRRRRARRRGAGVSLRHAPLDAIPDLSDVQVIVFTEWMGQSPDLVEDQITYPISSALISAPKVQAVRGQSMFGMSFVNVIFEDGTDIYWARSRVLEYLSSRPRQAAGRASTRRSGPDATGVGWVFEYALVDKTGKHDLAAAALDPGLEPALRARERAGRRRGGERRRLREAVPGQRRPEQAARLRHRRWTTSCARCARRTRRSAAACSRSPGTSR